MCKISIIMPMYNSIKYLDECIRSVMQQTLKDLEIIVVDAGSNDGTLEALHAYQKEDERIQIIHSDKKSMGYQYNIGIAAATGEYIGFVESDDYIVPDMYEKLYNTAIETGVDSVKCDYNFFMEYPEIGNQLIPVHEKKHMGYQKIFSPKDYPQQIIIETYMWNGLYKTEMVRGHQIILNETPKASYQDTGFVMQSYMAADSMIYIPDCLYCYRRDNQGSSAHMANNLMFEWWEDSYLFKWFETHPKEKEIFYGPWYIRSSFLYYAFIEKICNYTEMEDEVVEVAESFSKMLLENKPMPAFTFKDGSTDEVYSLHKESHAKGVREFVVAKRKMNAWRDAEILEKMREIMKYKKIIIFGCGDNGLGLLSYLLRKNCVEKILLSDNNASLYGGKIMGQKVISPEEMTLYPDYEVLIANAAYFDRILLQCLELGVSIERIHRAPGIMRIRGTNIMHEGEELPLI